MTDLEKIDNQLDKTRIALHLNFNAYDSDLPDTYFNFKVEAKKLIELLQKELSRWS